MQKREWNEMDRTESPLVGVVMGSQSDWGTMQHANQTLDSLGISNEARVISAHRTPDLLDEWIGGARERGMKVIIAGAGMAAHLAGVAAAVHHIVAARHPSAPSSSLNSCPSPMPKAAIQLGFRLYMHSPQRSSSSSLVNQSTS